MASKKSPAKTDKVKVHYTGTFITGEVFDTSANNKQPAEFPVNGVITGWSEALQKMRVGDKWKITIPSELAYGEEGSPPVIPPNAAGRSSSGAAQAARCAALNQFHRTACAVPLLVRMAVDFVRRAVELVGAVVDGAGR
jgi:hypothetical protein